MMRKLNLTIPHLYLQYSLSISFKMSLVYKTTQQPVLLENRTFCILNKMSQTSGNPSHLVLLRRQWNS